MITSKKKEVIHASPPRSNIRRVSQRIILMQNYIIFPGYKHFLANLNIIYPLIHKSPLNRH